MMTSGNLKKGRDKKTDKYTTFLSILAQELPRHPGGVLPFVIGTRGAMPKSSSTSL